MTTTAQYKCDDREYTVEVIDTDGEDVTIACNVFPMVFVRHVGWCEQPTMTVNKKWIYNVRDVEEEIAIKHVTEDEADMLHELIVLCNSDPAHIFRATDGSDNSVSGQWSEHGYY